MITIHRDSVSKAGSCSCCVWPPFDVDTGRCLEPEAQVNVLRFGMDEHGVVQVVRMCDVCLAKLKELG